MDVRVVYKCISVYCSPKFKSYMFGRIFTIVLLIVLVSDIYIFFLYIKKLTANKALRILWFLPSVLLLGGIYYFFFSGVSSSLRDVFSIVFIALTLPKIVFTVITLLDLPLRYFFRWKVYPFTIVALVLCLGIEYVIIYGSVWGKTKLDVKEVVFTSPDVPESFDGYKIIQVSDLHIGNWNGDRAFIQKMVDMIHDQKPDVVMVTGDLVHNRADELDDYEDILAAISAPDGVYSILGNHDYGIYNRWKDKDREKRNLQELKNRQTAMGWHLLNNEYTYLTSGNDSIALIGVENDGAPPFPQFGDLPKAMRGTENSEFKILLSHDPTHWRREVLDTDIDLMLSGHTHASQIMLGRFSFAAFVYSEWAGLYREGKQGLYVNVGIGHVGIPFRYGAFPEITVITLQKEK